MSVLAVLGVVLEVGQVLQATAHEFQSFHGIDYKTTLINSPWCAHHANLSRRLIRLSCLSRLITCVR